MRPPGEGEKNWAWFVLFVSLVRANTLRYNAPPYPEPAVHVVFWPRILPEIALKKSGGAEIFGRCSVGGENEGKAYGR